MGRGTFETEDSLNWLFFQNWVTETVCNVREFLFIGPFNIVFGATAVIVVRSSGCVSLSFLEVEFLGLREPCACGLAPSVVVLEEAVV